MWNTYGKMDDIPVAIVNHDQQLQYEGKTINVGYNLVEGLNKSDSLNYETVSDKKAESGIKSGKYYMVVTIPKDFSKNTTTLLTSHPKQLHLYYRLNSGRNFILSKMTTGTATAITNKVSKQVTQMYSTILLSTLSKVTNGLANIKYTKNTANYLASPVISTISDEAEIPNNGTGMAPFAIAIGIFVGGIALGTMFDAYYPKSKPKYALSWWASKTSVIAVIAFLQAILLLFTLTLGNHLLSNSQVKLFISILIGSITFLSIIFCLRIILGGFGTWLTTIILVLQISASSGLYPVELTSGFARAISPYLPMTYLIDALRHAISLGGGITTDMVIILITTFFMNIFIIFKFHRDKWLKLAVVNLIGITLINLTYYVTMQMKHYRLLGNF